MRAESVFRLLQVRCKDEVASGNCGSIPPRVRPDLTDFAVREFPADYFSETVRIDIAVPVDSSGRNWRRIGWYRRHGRCGCQNLLIGGLRRKVDLPEFAKQI